MKNIIILIVLLFIAKNLNAQIVNSNNSIVWSPGSNDSRISFTFYSKGIMAGVSEPAELIIHNNSYHILVVKATYIIYDRCGDFKQFTKTEKINSQSASSSSGAFLSGIDYESTCKSVNKLQANLITKIDHVVVTINSIEDLTAKEEQADLQRKKDETEKKKKEDEVKAANERIIVEEKKKTKVSEETEKQTNERASTITDKTSSSNGSTIVKSENDARMEALKREQERQKAEHEANIQRQKQYNEWKNNALEEKKQAETEAVAESLGVLTILGGWIYNDKMGNVNPDFVYDNPLNTDKVKLSASIEFGYSGSYYPLIFASEKTTMINGKYVSTKSLEKRNATIINFDVCLKIGAESENYGGYVFLMPKVGFSPLYDGYQLSPLVYGGRLFAGVKRVKAYGEYLQGNRGFGKTDNDPEESGKGNSDIKFQKLEYGLRFTTMKDDTYRRNHISIGMIMERLSPDGLYSFYSDPITSSLIKNQKSPWINGYAFQWKKDHTFNLYANVYPEYIYGGETSRSAGSPSSEFNNTKTGFFIELGFIRSIDFW